LGVVCAPSPSVNVVTSKLSNPGMSAVTSSLLICSSVELLSRSLVRLQSDTMFDIWPTPSSVGIWQVEPMYVTGADANPMRMGVSKGGVNIRMDDADVRRLLLHIFHCTTYLQASHVVTHYATSPKWYTLYLLFGLQ
jgi:hypothetical protein